MTINPVNEGEDADLRSLSTDVVQHTNRNASDAIELAENGGWLWALAPRALYNNGKTFTGWIGQDDGDVVVASYNHDTGAVTTNTVDAKFSSRDAHDTPTFMIGQSGYVWAFWSSHADADIYYKVSSATNDISSFGSRQTISNSSSTYQSPTQFSDGTIRVWGRMNNGHYSYQESTDNGSTWSSVQDVGSDFQYIIPYQDGDTVHFGVCGPSHPRTAAKNFISAFKYEHGSGFSREDGASLSAPFSIENDLNHVWDQSNQGYNAFIHDVKPDDNGNPRLAWASFDRGQYRDTLHEYYYASYDGSSWTTDLLTDAVGRSHIDATHWTAVPGLVIDEDPSTVYAAVGDHEASKLQKWERQSTGNWSYTDIGAPRQNNLHPVVPWNRKKPANLVYLSGEYSHWFNGFATTVRMSDGSPTNEANTAEASPLRTGGIKRYRTTDQTITTGAADDITWEQTQYNYYAAGLNKYRIIEPDNWGWFNISAAASIKNISSAGEIEISLNSPTNNTTPVLDSKTVSAGDTVTLSGSATVQVSPGKGVGLKLYQDTGSDVTVVGGQSKTWAEGWSRF